MKRLITTILFLLIYACVVNGQNVPAYSYTYDEAGNRIQRDLIFIQDNKSLEFENTQQDSVVYNYNVFSYDVKIYPNPTDGFLKVEIIDFPPNLSMQLFVYDTQGRSIFSTTTNTAVTEIDFSNQANGMYILQLIIDNRKKEWSVLKQ
jgi:hypothetical protein